MGVKNVFGRSAKFSAKDPHLKFQNLKKFWVKIPKFDFFFFKCGWESVKMSEYQKKISVVALVLLKHSNEFWAQK